MNPAAKAQGRRNPFKLILERLRVFLLFRRIFLLGQIKYIGEKIQTKVGSG